MIVGSAQADYWNADGDASALKRLDFLKKTARLCASKMSVILTQEFRSRFLIETKFLIETNDDDAGFQRALDLYKEEMISCKAKNTLRYIDFDSGDFVAAFLLIVLLKMNFSDVFHVAEAAADTDCENIKIMVWVTYIVMTTLNIVGVKVQNLPNNIYIQLSHSIMEQKPIAIEWAVLLMRTLAEAYGDASANRSG